MGAAMKYEVWKGILVWFGLPLVVIFVCPKYAGEAAFLGFFIAWMWATSER